MKRLYLIVLAAMTCASSHGAVTITASRDYVDKRTVVGPVTNMELGVLGYTVGTNNYVFASTNYVDKMVVAAEPGNYYAVSNAAMKAYYDLTEFAATGSVYRVSDGTNMIDAAGNIFRIDYELSPWTADTNAITNVSFPEYDPGVCYFRFNGYFASADLGIDVSDRMMFSIGPGDWQYNTGYGDYVSGPFGITFSREILMSTNHVGAMATTNELAFYMLEEDGLSRQAASAGTTGWSFKNADGITVSNMRYNDIFDKWEIEYHIGPDYYSAYSEDAYVPNAETVRFSIDSGDIEAVRTLVSSIYFPAYDGNGKEFGNWIIPGGYSMEIIGTSDYDSFEAILSDSQGQEIETNYEVHPGDTNIYFSSSGINVTRSRNKIIGYAIGSNTNVVFASHDMIKDVDLVPVTNYIDSVASNVAVSATNYVNEKIGDIKADRITDGTNVIDAAGNVSTIYTVGPIWEATTNIVTSVSVEYSEDAGAYIVGFLCDGESAWGVVGLSPSDNEFTLGEGYWMYEDGVRAGEFDITFIKTMHVTTNYIGKLALTNDLPQIDFTNINSNVRIIGAFAQGNTNVVSSGAFSHAEGVNTLAGPGSRPPVASVPSQSTGFASHAEGNGSHASGPASHAEGYHTIASGNNSHAEGENSEATQGDAHASGYSAKAQDTRSYVWNGDRTISGHYTSHGVGTYSINPIGGPIGFFIGGSNLIEVISASMMMDAQHTAEMSYGDGDDPARAITVTNYPSLKSVMRNVILDIVRENSLEGIWDEDLQVWWKPVMSGGSLRYVAATNVNLNAGIQQ